MADFESQIISFRDAIASKCSLGIFKLVITAKYKECPGKIEVADGSIYGASVVGCPVELWNEWDAGSRIVLECAIDINERKKRINFKYIALRDHAISRDDSMEGPPCVAILSHNNSHILTITNMNSTPFIDFKYNLSRAVQSSGDKVDNIINQFKNDLKHYATHELESLSAMEFFHRHDFPLDTTNQEVIRTFFNGPGMVLRELAAIELNERYHTGILGEGVKVDLPSGKFEVIFDSKGQLRYESALETAVRELEEETGIYLSDVQYMGSTRMVGAPAFEPFGSMQRSVFFFRPRDSIKMRTKDAYVRSSWTTVANIVSNIQLAISSGSRFGRFLSLSQYCNLEAIIYALDVGNATRDPACVDHCAERKSGGHGSRGKSWWAW